MEPYRAFIADKLPPSQLGKGFLAQSFFTGLGITLANISLFVFQKFISGATESGIPYWVVGSFMLGAVCSIGTVLVSVLRTPEIPPSAEELAALRAKKGGLGPAVKEIGEAIRDMPPQFRKLALVYFFQWYGMVCYWQFIALSIAKSVLPDTPEGKEEAVAWTGLVNGWYNIVTFSVAFSLVAFAKKRGARTVHCVCLLLAAVGLIIVPSVTNQYLIFIPDHRSRHRLGLDHGRAVHHGGPDDPVDPVRGLHGHHQHDDRHADAHPVADLRLDLREPSWEITRTTPSGSPAVFLGIAGAPDAVDQGTTDRAGCRRRRLHARPGTEEKPCR